VKEVTNMSEGNVDSESEQSGSDYVNEKGGNGMSG